MRVALLRIVFMGITSIFALALYLDARDLPLLEEKLIVVIIFWIYMLVTSFIMVDSVKTVLTNKDQVREYIKKLPGGIIKDKRFHFLIVMFIYIYVIPLIGFFIASYMLLIALTYILAPKIGQRERWFALLGQTIFLIALFILFVVVLKSTLPNGAFF